MRTSITAPLRTGGLALHHYVGRLLRVKFLWQWILLAALPAAAMLIASSIDHTLFMSGRNVGLLQHPTIWTFIGLQVALPLSIQRSLGKLANSRTDIQHIANSKHVFSKEIIAPLHSFLQLRGTSSRIIATLVYSIGLIAFIWNTYQNQLPGVIIPFDFWDSTNHLWGFWVTRIYKLYLFGWLLPYLALVHIGILVVILRFVRRMRIASRLKLQPFHPDGAGGLGFVPPLITNPVIVALLICSISAAAAFRVHRAFNVTPIMGLAIIVSFAAIAYILPVVSLRTDIVALKYDLTEKLTSLQQSYYLSIIDSHHLDFEILRRGNEALDYFDKVRARVSAISNYPHLKRLLRFIGLAMTPSVISLALSFYDHMSAFIPYLAKKH